MGGEILRGANDGDEVDVRRTISPRDGEDRCLGRKVEEVRTSSSSCSCSSLIDVLSESSDRRAMIEWRVDTAIGNAVRMDVSVREGCAGDPEPDPDPEPDRMKEGMVDMS